MAEPLNATFFAFRKRERGGVLLGASISFAVCTLILFAAFGGIVWMLLGGPEFWSYYQQIVAAQAGGETTAITPPNLTGALLIIPIEIVWLFLVFVLLAAYESSAVRWMLRGEQSGPLNLHFGADMWRVYGTYWVWLLYSVVGFVGFFIALMIGGFAGAALGDAGPLVVFAVCVLYLIAWFYTSVRLSPASATSIGIGEFSPFKAWSVSRGRFWALFGAYLLLFLLYIVAYTVLGSIFFGAFYAQILNQLDWTIAQSDPQAFMRSYEQASMAAMQSMFGNPVSLAMYVGGQLLFYAIALAFYLLWFGVEARAVQAALEEGKIERAS